MRDIDQIRNRAIHLEDGDYFDPKHEAAYLRKIANKLAETQAKADHYRKANLTLKRAIKKEVKLQLLKFIKEL